MLAASSRSQKERNLFIVALIFSSLVWVALVVSLVGLLYAPFVALGVVIGHAFFLARLTGNAIRVGSRQLPDLYRSVSNAAQKLGLDSVPEVYVVSGGGILNAFATKLFSRRFIVLNAEIIDACEVLDEGKAPDAPRAVDFIIAHELGHLALGHLSWAWLLWPAKLMPLIGPAYSRACEYSADACGLAVVNDVDTSSRALAVLAAGGRQAKQINLEPLLEQRHDTGGFVMALVELNSTHPFLSKRVAALHRARDAGVAPDVGRNPLSYIMAPMFGFAAGGGVALATVYMYVAVVGILAAVAIPNFVKYQERAKAAALGMPPIDAAGADANAAGSGAADAQKLNDLLAQLNQGQGGQLGGQVAQPQDGALAAGGGGLGLQGGVVNAPAEDDAPPPPPPPRFEAKMWLKGQLVAKNNDAISGFGTIKAAFLVDKLYKAGAPKVFVSDVGVDDKGVFANNIVVQMPEKALLRKRLVDLCTAEFKKQGYDEPCEDNGVEATPEIYFNWQK